MKALHVILPVISACLVLAAQGEWKKEGIVLGDTALRGQDAKIDKEKKTTPFHAISWLIVEPIANEEAQQAGTGQPATRPESKLEGGDKPQPEAEGRSR